MGILNAIGQSVGYVRDLRRAKRSARRHTAGARAARQMKRAVLKSKRNW
jgi:hypothetical protein